MANFIGGSAYAMVTGVADGYHAVTERTFRTMSRSEMDLFAQELDKHLREIRGEQAPLEDIPAIQHRSRRIQRLNNALMILRAYRQKTRS